MIEYHAFNELCNSKDSDKRGNAAHLAAMAYLAHEGPADERAALYAVLVNLLDDPSVKVRAALAYGLLHSAEAPRPVMLSLLNDSPVISRAVLQYSPVLVDADLVRLATDGDMSALLAIAQREKLSPRIATIIALNENAELTLHVLRRTDVAVPGDVLQRIAETRGSDARLRGALFARVDLPAPARLLLVRRATDDLRGCRLVKGALAPKRLDQVLRDNTDTAVTEIGERAETGDAFARQLVDQDQVNSRLLIHAMVTGRATFFAACLGALASVPPAKVFAVLERGSRTVLAALFVRCGLHEGLARLLTQLVLLARTADLSDDEAARHYVVTALTEELIAEYDGVIPAELEEAFCYLNEQNIALARRAARGVMATFAGTRGGTMRLPDAPPPMMEALPAA
jgi:uncharacterized protein (DUF2336 family)